WRWIVADPTNADILAAIRSSSAALQMTIWTAAALAGNRPYQWIAATLWMVVLIGCMVATSGAGGG
ncbi:MAG: hypothetical protein ACK5JJ_03490, partial [Cyanobacteriota bacterium]